MQFLNKNINFNTLYYYIICLLIFFIPLKMIVCSYLIGALVVVWIAEGTFREKFNNIRSGFFTILFISYFLIYLIGIIYSENFAFGITDIELKLSFFIFPIIFSTLSKSFYAKADLNTFFKIFILGCAVNSIICLSHSTYLFYQTNNTDVFYYITLSAIYHPGYLSMFINLAIAFIIYYLIENNSPGFSFSKFKYFVLLLFFFVMIILLSSKAGLISLAAIIFLSLLYISIYKKKYLQALIYLIIIIPVFIGLLALFPYSVKRAEQTQKSIMDKSYSNNKAEDGTSNRIQIWKASLSIIKENPLLGVGTGDVKDKLMEKYKQNRLLSAYERKLNAHNQFLQTTVAIGLIGLLILILGLLLPLFISIKEKQFLYTAFIILIIINISVEAMFEVNAGVVFYAFFNSLLFYNYKT